MFGANTYIPFDAGSARMTTVGDYLFIRTSHEMYKSSDGYHHQANVTIQVKMSTMEVTDSYTGVMNVNYGYVSHSFNQFICAEGNNIVAVDHGDAYPRSVVLINYPKDVTNGTFTPNYSNRCKVTNLITISGNVGANYTGVSVGGFEISDTAYIVVGNQDKDKENLSYSGYSNGRDIFVATKNKSTGAVSVKYVTDYEEGQGVTSTPQLSKIGSNSYMLLWHKENQVYYVKLDGNGNTVGSICSLTGDLSDCKPVLSGNELIWYTRDNLITTFYSINISSMEAQKKEVNTGHDYHYGTTVSNGTITRECIKCGDSGKVTVPTSFTCYWSTGDSSYYSYYSDRYNVGDVVYCCPYLNGTFDMNEMEAFSSDENVISIGESGGDFVLNMANPGLSYITVHPKYNPNLEKQYLFRVGSEGALDINEAECSSLNDMPYTGKAIYQDINVTYNGIPLTMDLDYTVTYSNNVNVGEATLTIAGKGLFAGEKVVHFNIICLDHKWDAGVVIKQPTYESEGVIRYTCLNCSITKDESIEKVDIPAETPSNVGIEVKTADRFGLSATLSISNSNLNIFEYSWYAAKDGCDEVKIKDWTTADSNIFWTPDVFGTYTVVGKVRAKGHPETEQSVSYIFEYHPHIKGKCQMPYSGEQGIGYLIGVESYENPDQKYQYEMLILDCTLLAQNLPAWTYTTGKFPVPQGNAGWCIWTPKYGYYWTLFRVYDENGVLIDEQCYGFANVC